MSLIYYNAEKGVALGDDPLSLGHPQEDLSPDPLEVDEWGTYFIRFFEADNPIEKLLDRWGGGVKKRRYPSNLWELSFEGHMGLTRIGPIRIAVRSRKLTEKECQSLFDYVGERFADLVFSFGTPTGVHYRKDRPGKDVPYIEFLFLDRFLLGSPPQIDMIAGLILSDPHRKQACRHLMRPPDAVRSFPASSIQRMLTSGHRLSPVDPDRSIARSSLAGRFREKTGKSFFPSEVCCEERYNTFDTNENRFVKFLLEHLARRVTILRKELSHRNESWLNPDIGGKLSLLDRKLSCFLSAPLWRDVGDMTQVPTNSQVLQKKDGYRQLFRLHCLLHLVTVCDFDSRDFEAILETKRISTLYEYWCFFVIKEILDRCSRPVSATRIVESDPVENKMIEGFQIDYKNHATLRYNRNYGVGPSESYSHGLRPDIVIAIESREIVFDAKFKGKVGGEGDGVGGAWSDDIDKMHAYRDALANVGGAFILYPGNVGTAPELYKAHGGKAGYEGVGAFPLKPGEDGRPDSRQVNEVEAVIRGFLLHRAPGSPPESDTNSPGTGSPEPEIRSKNG